jgi:hypothetical protein
MEEKLSNEEIENEINHIRETEEKEIENIKLDMKTAIEYFTERRDKELERFNNSVKNEMFSDDDLRLRLNIVLRVNTQLKTLKNCEKAYKYAKRCERNNG